MLINQEIETKQQLEEVGQELYNMYEEGAISKSAWQEEIERLHNEYSHLLNEETGQEKQATEEKSMKDQIVEEVLDQIMPLVDDANNIKDKVTEKVEQVKSKLGVAREEPREETDLDMISEGFLCDREFWDENLDKLSQREIKTMLLLTKVCDKEGKSQITQSELAELGDYNANKISQAVSGLEIKGLVATKNTRPKTYKIPYSLDKGGFVVSDDVLTSITSQKSLKRLRTAMYIMCRNYHSPNYTSTPVSNLGKIKDVSKARTYDETIEVLEDVKDILHFDFKIEKEGWYTKKVYKVFYDFNYSDFGFITEEEKEKIRKNKFYERVKQVLNNIEVSQSWYNIKQAIKMFKTNSESVRQIVIQNSSKFKSKYNSVKYLKWMFNQAEDGFLYCLE